MFINKETAMLDATPAFSNDVADWRDTLSHGDVVSFRFPFAEGGEDAPLKDRPCLVIDVETILGEKMAVLAYGTTSWRRSNVGYEIHVRSRAERLAAGLDAPTRFVGARRILAPLSHSGFVVSRVAGSPVLGRLEGEPFERLNQVRGRIHALRDIAAERRRRDRPRRRKSAVAGKDFLVERRRPRRRVSPKGAK